jgi:hypothetical protein
MFTNTPLTTIYLLGIKNLIEKRGYLKLNNEKMLEHKLIGYLSFNAYQLKP